MVIKILTSQPLWWIQFILTLAVLGIGIVQFIRLYVNKSSLVKRTNVDLIIILGISIAIVGIAAQIFGMIMAFEAILTAADVSPAMVSEGFRISFYTTFYGLFVLLFSGIIWYVNKIKWEAIH